MEKVESGLFVSVEYTGTLDNGEVFDSSKGRQPLEVQMGAGNLIPGFESALMGMAINEAKTFTLSPEEAYGQRDENRMHEFPKSEIPEGASPQVGQTLMLSTPQGQQISRPGGQHRRRENHLRPQPPIGRPSPDFRYPSCRHQRYRNPATGKLRIGLFRLRRERLLLSTPIVLTVPCYWQGIAIVFIATSKKGCRLKPNRGKTTADSG